jgi:CheY-like chemotaxis protein
MRILVVDDYAPFCNSVRLMLRDHQVEVALDGREAIARLAGDPGFDVLLLDLNMPGVSGLDVYEHLKRGRPEAGTRVIFMTGGATTRLAAERLDALDAPRLAKPFREPELRALLAGAAGTR